MTDRDKRIEAALAVLDKATPGPWKSGGCAVWKFDGDILADLAFAHNEPTNTEANATLMTAAPDMAAEVIRLRKELVEYEMALASEGALVLNHEGHIAKLDAEIDRLRKWKDDAFCHVEISRNYLSTELKAMKDDGSGVIDQLNQFKDEADRLIAEAGGGGEVMESARDFIERVAKVKRGYGWDMNTIIDLQEARDASIRRECADRAVEWCEKWADEPWHQVTKDTLRAAIEGANHE